MVERGMGGGIYHDFCSLARRTGRLRRIFRVPDFFVRLVVYLLRDGKMERH